MTLRPTLRVLVLLELACQFLAGFTGVVRESSLPEPLRTYSEAQGTGDLTGNEATLVVLGLALMVAMAAASVGLLASWRPARMLYTSTRAASVAMNLLFGLLVGPYVDDGWTEMFDAAAFMVAGMVLGLLWWSPLAATFDRLPPIVVAPAKAE